jgi:hypothetical protein
VDNADAGPAPPARASAASPRQRRSVALASLAPSPSPKASQLPALRRPGLAGPSEPLAHGELAINFTVPHLAPGSVARCFTWPERVLPGAPAAPGRGLVRVGHHHDEVTCLAAARRGRGSSSVSVSCLRRTNSTGWRRHGGLCASGARLRHAPGTPRSRHPCRWSRWCAARTPWAGQSAGRSTHTCAGAGKLSARTRTAPAAMPARAGRPVSPRPPLCQLASPRPPLCQLASPRLPAAMPARYAGSRPPARAGRPAPRPKAAAAAAAAPAGPWPPGPGRTGCPAPGPATPDWVARGTPAG